jgi:hypothetical protein
LMESFIHAVSDSAASKIATHSHTKFPRLGLLKYLKHSDLAGVSTLTNERPNQTIRCYNSTVSTKALAPCLCQTRFFNSAQKSDTNNDAQLLSSKSTAGNDPFASGEHAGSGLAKTCALESLGFNVHPL